MLYLPVTKWHSTTSGIRLKPSTISKFIDGSLMRIPIIALTLYPSAVGSTSRRKPRITPDSSIFFTRWWIAAPEIPHSRAISRKGMRALRINRLRILRSVASMVAFPIIQLFSDRLHPRRLDFPSRSDHPHYLITPSSRPTFVKAATHLSRCDFSWPAETCTRIRACPFGTTG